MKVEKLDIEGALHLRFDVHEDLRGSFSRVYCSDDLRDLGLPGAAQVSISHNERRGTLRGMHFQVGDHAEQKLVRCVRGTVFDVIVDLRPDSATRLSWCARVLAAADGDALLVPEGCAHGFLSLDDDSDLVYVTSTHYVGAAASGVSPFDPVLGIDWPAINPLVMSDQDRSWPPLEGPS